MSVPSTAALNARLTSLSTQILERSRVVSLNLSPSASTESQIVRSLTFVRDGLTKVEDQAKGNGGTVDSGVRELGERYDRMIGLMEQDDIGREKVKGLARPVPSPIVIPEDLFDSTDASSTSTTRPVPDLQILPPTPALSTFPSETPWRVPSHSAQGSYRDDISDYAPSDRAVNENENENDEDDLVVHPSGTIPADRDPLFNPERFKGRRGSYDPDEEEEGERRGMISEQQILQDQRGVMDDQDARLDLLSHSINRHHHMSLQIGDELDLQNELLDDTDARMDGTAARMSRAGRSLDKVAKGSREHVSSITIVALIVILLLLIIVFKT